MKRLSFLAVIAVAFGVIAVSSTADRAASRGLSSTARDPQGSEIRDPVRSRDPADSEVPSRSAGLRSVPAQIAFQGFLTDDTGSPIDATVSLDLALYDAVSAGNRVWPVGGPESHPAVIVNNGVFQIALGETDALDPADFDGSPLFLGISVNGEAELPRTQLLAAPFAMRAAVADSAVAGGGGADADWVIVGDDMHAGVPGHVGIGTSTPQSPLHLLGDGAVVEQIETGSPDGSARLKLQTPGELYHTFTMTKYGSEATGEVDGIPLASASQLVVGSGAGSLLLRLRGTHPMHFLTDNLERMRITGAGDVGLGTPTPTEKLDVAGTVRMNGFKLPTGATPGHVLTADASGVGTWQPAVGGADGDWTIDGSDMYSSISGNVGIGTTNPTSKLQVNGGATVTGIINGGKVEVYNSSLNAGVFESNFSSDGVIVLNSEYTGAGSFQATAVRGKSRPADYYGIGGSFEGGRTGQISEVFPSGTQSYTGSYGKVIGGSGTNYAVRGNAQGAGINYGVFGEAYGGSTNWAGYFTGDVYTGGDAAFIGNVDVNGYANIGGFNMTAGATAGHVLTSDASGVGTWQPVAGGGIGGSGTANYIPKFTGSMTVGNSAIYQDVDNEIGIGLLSPGAKLEVETGSGDAIVGRCNPVGPTDYVAVRGYSMTADYYGIGGSFVGGWMGIDAAVNPSGSETYTAGRFRVTGGSGTNYGVSSSASGNSEYNIAGSFEATGGGQFNTGIYAHASGGLFNDAGYFDGDVDIYGWLYKSGGSFKIDHPLDPENKYLSHSFVESPDMMNIYNGNVILDRDGEAWVTMPQWFEALNMDFRYQLTPIGAPGPDIYVAEEIRGNRFKIAGGTRGMKVSWQVTGIRHDAYAEKHRLPVEEMKPERERGFYLNADAYGLPEEMSSSYQIHRKPREEREILEKEREGRK
ncbi:MAG: hypothetical protein ACYTG0_37395 [Planctomycetota bacterium]|jgi:hypothetical protein